MRHRRRTQPEWKLNWRNPELVVLTRIFVGNPIVGYTKVAAELTAPEMQSLSNESMRYSNNPGWRADPSYNWSRRKRKKP